MFSSIKTKTNLNFSVKYAEKSIHLFLLSIWWITFRKDLSFLTYNGAECTQLTWLCKHMKSVRSSQVAILVLDWVKLNFSLWVSLMYKISEKKIAQQKLLLWNTWAIDPEKLFTYLSVFRFCYSSGKVWKLFITVYLTSAKLSKLPFSRL